MVHGGIVDSQKALANTGGDEPGPLHNVFRHSKAMAWSHRDDPVNYLEVLGGRAVHSNPGPWMLRLGIQVKGASDFVCKQRNFSPTPGVA